MMPRNQNCVNPGTAEHQRCWPTTETMLSLPLSAQRVGNSRPTDASSWRMDSMNSPIRRAREKAEGQVALHEARRADLLHRRDLESWPDTLGQLDKRSFCLTTALVHEDATGKVSPRTSKIKMMSRIVPSGMIDLPPQTVIQ